MPRFLMFGENEHFSLRKIQGVILFEMFQMTPNSSTRTGKPWWSDPQDKPLSEILIMVILKLRYLIAAVNIHLLPYTTYILQWIWLVVILSLLGAKLPHAGLRVLWTAILCHWKPNILGLALNLENFSNNKNIVILACMPWSRDTASS